MMRLRIPGSWLLIIFLTAVVSVSGASYYFGVGPFSRGRTELVVSTTTSLYDTGLLDEIENAFEEKFPVEVYFISAGTGTAIAYAQRGDADMILVHAPSSELPFLEGGYGVCRKIIAYNFFAIIGPSDDPARISGLPPTEALARIIEAGRTDDAIWVSRGDGSGTHTKERELWVATGLDLTEFRDEDWYLESGLGMGKTLLITNEHEAYTLADMGTYLKYSLDGLVSLVVIVDAGKELLNAYSSIMINEAYNPEVNFEAALEFTKFLISEECQLIIDEFGQDVYPKKLFYSAVQLLKDATNVTLVEWIEDFAYFNGVECPEEYQDGHKELYP